VGPHERYDGTPLVCGPLRDSTGSLPLGVAYGCNSYVTASSDSQLVGMPSYNALGFNEYCSVVDQGLAFECYQMAASTNFGDFVNLCESTPIKCDEDNSIRNDTETPKFIYQVFFSTSNEWYEHSSFRDLTSTATFNETLASRTLFAKLSKAEASSASTAHQSISTQWFLFSIPFLLRLFLALGHDK